MNAEFRPRIGSRVWIVSKNIIGTVIRKVSKKILPYYVSYDWSEELEKKLITGGWHSKEGMRRVNKSDIKYAHREKHVCTCSC
jgi:hypothetical protein